MSDEYLMIYQDKSIYVSSGTETEYIEGPQSETAHRHQESVKDALEKGWLDSIIKESVLTPDETELITPQFSRILHHLVESITSEVGRAIVGLTVLQLVVKSIAPTQSVRLHKASNSKKMFSWRDGISMRTIDSAYITPKLREYNLLKLNKFGVMVTRSLAENYPYTTLYKAETRGAKEEWFEIINTIENAPELALPALKFVINLLKRRSDDFQNKVVESIKILDEYLAKSLTAKMVLKKLFSFPKNSSYSARLFEILIHSFYCTIVSVKGLDLFLKPLSQMRSANKKHGNIGDIELLERPNTMLIVEAWDAKFGKMYLRDELEELKDKLESHPETKIAGFITNEEPVLNSEIKNRKSELEELFDIEIIIESIDSWYKKAILEYKLIDELSFLKNWIKMFFEYLCLLQYKTAPIDEPTYDWIEECIVTLKQ
jgi:hypothetical protein